MEIAGVAKAFNETNLKLLKQVGVDHLIHYDLLGTPVELDELKHVLAQVERHGLKVSGVESGPPIDKIVMGKEGREEQLDQYCTALRNMGKLGIRMVCYNFMPQISTVAMVVRTSMEYAERGGALTSQYRATDFDPNTVPHNEDSTTDEQIWDNLEYFLKRVVPVAEDAEVKLAMHPDDPPVSPMCGLARILRDEESFARLVSLVDSPVNGITFCQGCFAEMGCDLQQAIRRFADRINFVHFRDVAGPPDDFHETFPDNGPRDMVKILQTYRDIDYRGLIRVDHVPLLVTEAGGYDGYGMHGHIFAIGYLKGLMEPIFGKPAG